MSQKIQVKCLAAILALAVSATAQAEFPVVEWIRQLGTAGDDWGMGVSLDDNGNAYVTGYTDGSLDSQAYADDSDIFLTKYTPTGSKLWTRQLGTAGDDWGKGVSVDGSGNAYVTGFTEGGLDGNIYAGGNRDVFLTKYDMDGTKQWTRQLGTASYDIGSGVSVDGNGNAYVTGYTSGGIDGNTNAGIHDIFLTKYNAAGIKQWTRQLGTAYDETGWSVSVDGIGTAYITGYTGGGLDGNSDSGGFSDMFLTKYGTDGTKQWTRQLGTSDMDIGKGVSVDGSGNVYVTGETWGGLDGNANAGFYDMFLSKYDTDGTKLWTRQLGTVGVDDGTGVSVDGSGNAYVAGRTSGDLDGNTNVGGSDIFLTKYDTDGYKLWTQQLGTASTDYGQAVSVDDSGNAYVTGYTFGSLGNNISAGGSDIFLVKISSIPEPGSITMLICGVLSLICRRRWR